MSTFQDHRGTNSVALQDLLRQVAAGEVTPDRALQHLLSPSGVAQVIHEFTGEVEVTVKGFDHPQYWDFDGSPVREWVSPSRSSEASRIHFFQSARLWQNNGPQLIKNEGDKSLWVGIDTVGDATIRESGILGGRVHHIAMGVLLQLRGKNGKSSGA